MLLMDVNVLGYAYRKDARHHPRDGEWLESVMNGDGGYAVAEWVLSGFVRVVTPRASSSNPAPWRPRSRSRTKCGARTSLRWRSNREARGSRPTATTPGFHDCGGGIL